MTDSESEIAAIEVLVLQEFTAAENRVALEKRPDPATLAKFREQVAKLPTERQAHWHEELDRINKVIASF